MEDDILQFGDVLTIKDPTVKQITLNEVCHTPSPLIISPPRLCPCITCIHSQTSYNTIVVEQPLQMLLNGRKINVRKAIPGVDV